MGIPAFCTVKGTLICAGLLALLAGCAAPQPSLKDSTHDLINAELVKAATAVKVKPAQPDTAGSALLPPLQIEMPKTGKSLEQKFDLVVNNAPAAQVFMGIVSGTRYSVLLHSDVTGTISVNLKDVTVIEALDTIREVYGYEYKVQGTRIFIQPLSLQTRVFKVNYLMASRSGNSNTIISSGSRSSTTGTTGTTTGTTGTTGVAQPTGGGSGAGGGGGVAVSVSTDTAKENGIWGDLRKAISAIIGAGDTGSPGAASGGAASGGATAATPSVVISPQSGLIVVRALPRELREVENYLKSSQLIVERQVMLEAKILEVRLSEGYQAGVNWSSFQTRSGANSHLAFGSVAPGATMNPTLGATAQTLTTDAASVLPGVAGSMAATALGGGFVGLAFQTANFAALLNFLETQGNVSVLSSPRIATLNNQKAVLKVGTDEVYITGFTVNPATTSGSATTLPTVTPTSEMLFSGISLDVTPQMDEDGNIVLHVHPAISTLSEVQKTFNLGSAGGIISLPLASRNVRETDSIVRAQNGNIVAIGGLMSQYQTSDRSGLPGTTSTPLGVLAGQRGAASDKRELVILLKPTIIQDSDSWSQDILQSQQRFQALKREPKAMNAEQQ